jgi:dihydroorotase
MTMSSSGRKAPFVTHSLQNGWLVSQKGSDGQVARAWALLANDVRVVRAEGKSAAEDLIRHAKAQSAFHREIPSTWVSLPTGLDLQVHLRYPGQPHKETLEGGLESALLGGYDSIVSMPNTAPFLDNPQVLMDAEAKAEETASGYPVKIGFAASATLGMKGEIPTDVAALKAAGAVAITDDGWGVRSDAAQEQLMEACAASDILFQQHAEMPGHRGVTPEGPFGKKHNLPEYPRAAESEMIRRDLALLRKHPKARYHVLHVSTRESIAEIRKAKGEGLRVSAEVTPHHLIFSNHDIPESSDPRCAYFKMNPPLFSPEDRQALREALADGTIDCVSTDHAPHETELKAKDWLQSPFGTRGLETSLPALLTLVKEGALSLERVEEVFSSAPRKLLGHPDFNEPSGMLFVDPDRAYVVDEAELPGVSRNSCFLGATLHGRIELRMEPFAAYTR